MPKKKKYNFKFKKKHISDIDSIIKQPEFRKLSTNNLLFSHQLWNPVNTSSTYINSHFYI